MTLAFEDDFDGHALDAGRWLPYYLPHWSTRERTAARYELADSLLRLRIDRDHEPWCPEWDGDVRTSSLQTGQFSGPLGSAVGQLRFTPGLRVREEQEDVRLYTPRYGRFEVRMKALDDPLAMVAFWMIGYEDEPGNSGEICVAEIFGRDVHDDHVAVGMGIHPFHDPGLTEEWAQERVEIDARDFHVYAADWTPDGVAWFVDGAETKRVAQSPSYPMQLMLDVYEFRDGGPPRGDYPKVLEVDWVRGYRP